MRVHLESGGSSAARVVGDVLHGRDKQPAVAGIIAVWREQGGTTTTERAVREPPRWIPVGVADDASPLRIPRSCRDSGGAHRSTVRQSSVTVYAAQPHRVIGNRCVERQRSRELLRRPKILIPPAAEDPL